MILARYLLRPILFIGLLLALAGMGTSPSLAQAPKGINEEFLIENSARVSKVKAYYKGNTVMSYQKPYGTQIEYFTPGGKTFLWYPGNRDVVRGEWKVGTGKDGYPQTCFRYQANSVNPFTKVPGGKWQCAQSIYMMFTDKQRIKGDAFGLSQQMPFKLSKRKTSFKRLAKKAKIDARGLRYLPTASDK
ncbi:hypothetical protein MXMO3_00234 [Maritalea myrionectae]|uniref:DUF995 domain-containing protein n=1 Tax=Maritalea myrionectae TaxID=454601 RepID=A0A2R4M9V1_9HYPH|nr:hypothetical protein [Maritalea myrionectae]AVX02782.1 hypothetical protein MXMO3_00234 [Maritalea myrionectae]